jgi:TPR repeat protein
MFRLGRAYRDGKGVAQDLYAAADWFRKASESNVDWIKNELFDVLWRIGTPESYSEMIRTATEFANAGDGGAMARLGRAYKEGRGVKQDLYEASDWFRRAIDHNMSWIRNELFDALWQIVDPSTNLLEIIAPLVEIEDGGAMARMSRLYRDGRGVTQDLYIAADWLRKAIKCNVYWAKNELFDVLWRVGTPEAYSEMICVATDFADTGDGEAMGRLGRAYRDGKGVPLDHNVAAQWYTKARDRGVLWAEKELTRLDLKQEGKNQSDTP